MTIQLINPKMSTVDLNQHADVLGFFSSSENLANVRSHYLHVNYCRLPYLIAHVVLANMTQHHLNNIEHFMLHEQNMYIYVHVPH